MSAPQFSEFVFNDPAKGEGWCEVEVSYDTIKIITDEYEGVALLDIAVAERLLEVLPRAIAWAKDNPFVHPKEDTVKRQKRLAPAEPTATRDPMQDRMGVGFYPIDNRAREDCHQILTNAMEEDGWLCHYSGQYNPKVGRRSSLILILRDMPPYPPSDSDSFELGRETRGPSQPLVAALIEALHEGLMVVPAAGEQSSGAIEIAKDRT